MTTFQKVLADLVFSLQHPQSTHIRFNHPAHHFHKVFFYQATPGNAFSQLFGRFVRIQMQ